MRVPNASGLKGLLAWNRKQGKVKPSSMRRMQAGLERGGSTPVHASKTVGKAYRAMRSK